MKQKTSGSEEEPMIKQLSAWVNPVITGLVWGLGGFVAAFGVVIGLEFWQGSALVLPDQEGWMFVCGIAVLVAAVFALGKKFEQDQGPKEKNQNRIR